jgi:CPA2 family monovalent cation:H+ antiporter-2
VDAWVLLADIVVLLAASLLLGAVFSRFRQSPLVGYILAGMVLGGPGSIQVVRSPQAIEAIAELGVSLLLFSLGLEFAWSQLKKLGTRTLAAGTLQVLVTTVLGAVAGFVAGLPGKEAVAVGAMVSLSSTAVVLRVLVERAESDSAHGRNCLAVLLVQDMAVVPLAMLVAMLGGGESLGEVAANTGKILLLAVGLIAGLYLILNKIAVHALGRLTLERNRELTIILAIVTGLGSAWVAHSVGVSPALGAFISGMFLGSSPFATQIRADISSLRVVLLTLFFGAAGMVADPLWILQNLPLVLGISLLLMIGKAAILSGIFRALGQAAPIAAATGISLAQIGEFAFVLGSIGRANGVLAGETYLLIVSVAIVTLIASPLLLPAAPSLGMRFASLLRGSRLYSFPKRDSQTRAPDVVIIGFGPAGQIAAQAFLGRGQRVLVIDLNRDGVKKAQELGLDGHVGDATQIDVLEHAKVDSAKAVVITVPHHRSAIRILEQVRRLAAHAHVVVRSRYQRHTEDFAMAGAHVVIGDEEQIGDSLGGHLRAWLASHDQPESGSTQDAADPVSPEHRNL